MIEKFFEMERLFISFILTIVIVAFINVIFTQINKEVDDQMLLFLSGIIFVMIKLLFANYDFYKKDK